jgi:hypothetical protein
MLRSDGHCIGATSAPGGGSPDGSVNVAELAWGRSTGSTDSISVPCPGRRDVSETRLAVGAIRSTASGAVAENELAVAVVSVAPAVGGVIPGTVDPAGERVVRTDDTGEMT